MQIQLSFLGVLLTFLNHLAVMGLKTCPFFSDLQVNVFIYLLKTWSELFQFFLWEFWGGRVWICLIKTCQVTISLLNSPNFCGNLILKPWFVSLEYLPFTRVGRLADQFDRLEIIGSFSACKVKGLVCFSVIIKSLHDVACLVIIAMVWWKVKAPFEKLLLFLLFFF